MSRPTNADRVRRILTDPAFRVGPDVRREELVDILAARVATAEREAAARAWDEGASEGLRTTPRLGYWLSNPYRADERTTGTTP